MKKFLLYIILSLTLASVKAQVKIVVDPSGKGNFTSIQSAINSLSDSSATARIIFIKKGIYKEKIFISKHNIVLEGEDRSSTIITQDIARDEWRCEHPDDWGVATMNLNGNDITLLNFTIANDYGFNNKESRTINCASDSTGKKTITNNGHQMALRSIRSTRIRAVNCHFRAYAGDTVSPWNLQDGMFYFKDCIMEGGVDFYCPRGWAYAENCQFITNTGPAAIWHDGSLNPDFKTVLKNCSFDGYKGFNLGRYHRDAHFYLVNCRFSENMADRDIYLVPTSNILEWGRRVYYYNAQRTGGNYEWHKDNLHTAPGAPDPSDIDADWVFDGRWKPQLENTFNFIPSVNARMKKRSADGIYGAALKKEIMPAVHKPNDFTVTPIPFYMTEGPAWENDKVGFRLYFDQRNAKDIFGKTTPFMVMDTVGSFGDKYYHHLDSRWGMDLLKVGTSLGAGAIAIQVKHAGKDTLVRLGGNVGETIYELVKSTNTQAVIRLTYKNWKVLNRNYNLVEEISISKGKYYYESVVTIDGLKGDEKLVTGIVNLKTASSYKFTEGSNGVLFTHDLQSENNDMLGMAILTPLKFLPVYSEAPRTGAGITNTFLVALDVRNNEPVRFRFYACWEGTDADFRDKNKFQQFLRKEAAAWKTSPVKHALKRKLK
jgi:pectinesterase